MNTEIQCRYGVLFEYAKLNGLDYEELCMTVRDAIVDGPEQANAPVREPNTDFVSRGAMLRYGDERAQAIGKALDALRELADEGTVLVSAWVYEDEIRSYRVTARGRDGWRKSADGKTLESALIAAEAADWSPQNTGDE